MAAATNDTRPSYNEKELARAGGAVEWGVTNADAAHDQIGAYACPEDAYYACEPNVEDTLNEWGFDLSTARGRDVVGEASRAFDARFQELTGFDPMAD